MTPRNRKVFLDTSVIFSAALSPAGGARKLILLGEAGLLQLIIGSNVLRECEEVVRRKAPVSLPTLAQLLGIGRVEISPTPTREMIEMARTLVGYEPDAYVLAEAIRAEPDWFVTHDKEHFLNESEDYCLDFQIGTPGDLLQSIKDDYKLT